MNEFGGLSPMGDGTVAYVTASRSLRPLMMFGETAVWQKWKMKSLFGIMVDAVVDA